ncbi:MAG: 50S ribosomal protein L10 [Campylobacteraceae bacterium]|jgi:large subunit ribosomal protein L10|nr:50S ribosomal protein L10 [Campylobacteraceae bacterium]
MTKEDKVELVSALTAEFKASDAVVVCDYKGLKVKTIEALRNKARAEGVKVQVVKNTLAGIAMKNADIPDLALKDTNIFVWGEDGLKVSKIVTAFAKSVDSGLFVVKSAFIGGEFADASKVEALSKMPSRDELIAMLLQVWNAPITNFTIGLDALRAKKEQSA